MTPVPLFALQDRHAQTGSAFPPLLYLAHVTSAILILVVVCPLVLAIPVVNAPVAVGVIVRRLASRIVAMNLLVLPLIVLVCSVVLGLMVVVALYIVAVVLLVSLVLVVNVVLLIVLVSAVVLLMVVVAVALLHVLMVRSVTIRLVALLLLA